MLNFHPTSLDPLLDGLFYRIKKAIEIRCDIPNVTTEEAYWVISKSKRILKSEPTLLEIKSPIVVVGDIHGQCETVIRLFNRLGTPEKVKYLFLGDYVDRGDSSVELLCILLCYKIKYPNNIFLLRGNHETESISGAFGFFIPNYNPDDKRFINEIKEKRMGDLWFSFNDLFKNLSLSAVINKRIFCVHGGLSPELKSIDEIRNVKKPIEVGREGLIADLLWSDPKFTGLGWSSNESRKISSEYGSDIVDEFLKENELDLLCRGHQVPPKGFEFPFGEKRNCVTISSCETDKEQAAIMFVDSDLNISFSYI